MRSNELFLDLIEVHWRRVDDPRVLRRERDDLLGNERTRVQAHRTTRHQIAPPHGDEVRCSRPRPNEMNGHDVCFRSLRLRIALTVSPLAIERWALLVA